MAMVINTNTASLTTQRHLSSSRNEMEVSMERMSSGSRINSSMDDAAGLAIGNRMTSQIEGLNQAVRNANDGISLAQTAEGALGSSQNILQRMRVLAVQAANDTYSSVDRKAINNEIVQLKEELNRGVNQASFNGNKILNGTNASFTFQVGHMSGDNVVVTLGDMRGGKIGTQSWNTKAQTANTAVPATATMTISGSAIKASDTMTMTAGTATFAHTFAADGDLATSAAAYVTAWNASTDSNVSLYTASNVAGAITITEDTATTGDLTVAGSVAQVGSDTAVPATATLTFSTKAVAGNNTTATVGSATLSYDFLAADFATAGSETVTEAATGYVAAWNASSDAEVSKFTASNSAGVVTFTQNTASTGALIASVTNAASSGTAVVSTIAAGATGIAAVTAVSGTGTVTITTEAQAVGNTLKVTIGEADFTYTAVNGDLASVTASAASFVAKWNLDTDADVSKFTAANSAGVITFTQDTAGDPAAGAVTPVSVETGFVAGDAAGITAIAGVTAVKNTATQTFTVAAGANEIVEVNVGSASFTHNFGASAPADVTATAAALVTAWNGSTDTNVAKFTASSTGGVVTYTQDVATAGALTVSKVDGGTHSVASTAAAGTTGLAAASDIALAAAAAAGTKGVAGRTSSVTSPLTVAAVTAVTAVPATATMTISGSAIKASDTMTMTAGTATFAHTFAADGDLANSAAAYVAAWNASTDVNVSLYTASNVSGLITITEDTATAGNLTVAGSVSQVGGSSNIAVAAVAAAGTFGIAGAAEQESYDFSGIALTTGDRVSLTIGDKTYSQEFTTNQASTLSALGALVVNGDATYASKTVGTDGKLVFTGVAAGTAMASATTAVQTSYVSAANSVDDILVTDATSAKASLAVIDGALDMMSDFRARLGASSNRMFITVDNLMSMSENTGAARSRIVDADFAAESAALAKSQVLQKAGTAMLSQANASTQDILNLLK